VFISQVDRQVIDVEAESESEARNKGYLIWLEQYAHSYAESVELVDDSNTR
jgi:hypothetical protein